MKKSSISYVVSRKFEEKKHPNISTSLGHFFLNCRHMKYLNLLPRYSFLVTAATIE